jgi:hypothetical protein
MKINQQLEIVHSSPSLRTCSSRSSHRGDQTDARPSGRSVILPFAAIDGRTRPSPVEPLSTLSSLSCPRGAAFREAGYSAGPAGNGSRTHVRPLGSASQSKALPTSMIARVVHV